MMKLRMRTNCLVVLLMTTVLVSCAPAVASVPSAETAIPTLTAIPPTARPHSLLLRDTFLLAGPGNVDFDTIAALKANETVYPMAIYGDFAQVTANSGGRQLSGYIHKSDLGGLAADLPTLNAGAVPLKPLYSPQCAYADYNLPLGEQTFQAGDNGDTPIQTDAPIAFDAPLRVRIDGMRVTGAAGSSFRLFGHLGDSNAFLEGLITIGIGSKDGNYAIDILDGSGGSYDSGDLGLGLTQAIQIVFEQTEGKSFQVLDGNGKLLRHVDLSRQSGLALPNGLFPDRRVYIAPSLPAHSSLTVSGLQIGTQADGQWVQNGATSPGLAELAAARHLTFGTEFSLKENMDARYCRAMHRDFNVAVLNSFSWKGIWLGPGQYDFSSLDSEVDYAVRQGWRVRASHLVWGDESISTPDWLKNGHFTRDQYIGFLEEHVKTLVGRYKGRVSEWSIANEATSRSIWPGADFWNEKIGPDYIEMAFRWAREADPNAVLIFNDANNESPRDHETQRVVTTMYNTVKELKEKGVPIDVVGMEMHLLLKYSSPIAPAKESVLATMRKFASLGVKIYVTEFDVDLHKRPGTPEERLQYEADLYKAMLEACLESNACESFATWGVGDATSWITQACSDPGCINEPDGDPLLFDRDYNPKPAYFAVRDVLLDFSNASSP